MTLDGGLRTSGHDASLGFTQRSVGRGADAAELPSAPPASPRLQGSRCRLGSSGCISVPDTPAVRVCSVPARPLPCCRGRPERLRPPSGPWGERLVEHPHFSFMAIGKGVVWVAASTPGDRPGEVRHGAGIRDQPLRSGVDCSLRGVFSIRTAAGPCVTSCPGGSSSQAGPRQFSQWKKPVGYDKVGHL